MTDAEALVGARYEALADSPIFQGRTVPERELVVDQSYVSVLSLGISLVLPEHDVVWSVQLHAEGHESYRQFGHDLPAGLAFDLSQEQVRARLGDPESSGEEKKVLLLGPQPAWERYLVDGRRVHIQYGADKNTICMISISEGFGAERLKVA